MICVDAVSSPKPPSDVLICRLWMPLTAGKFYYLFNALRNESYIINLPIHVILCAVILVCFSLLIVLWFDVCSQLGDDCLAATASSCSAIQTLVLAGCPAVGPAGLLALKELPRLTMLDLSYTFLTDLSPVFEACPHLKVTIHIRSFSTTLSSCIVDSPINYSQLIMQA